MSHLFKNLVECALDAIPSIETVDEETAASYDNMIKTVLKAMLEEPNTILPLYKLLEDMKASRAFRPASNCSLIIRFRTSRRLLSSSQFPGHSVQSTSSSGLTSCRPSKTNGTGLVGIGGISARNAKADAAGRGRC